MEANPTFQMLDQLWRVLSMGVLTGFCYALGAAPVFYGLLKITKGRR